MPAPEKRPPRTPVQRLGTALVILAIVLLAVIPVAVPVPIRVGAVGTCGLMLLGYLARKGRGE
jgi:hypothetical protein